MLDVKRLIGEVAAQNGIRLEPNDPAFALVTLNQLVLEETANRLFERVSTTLAEFNDALRKGEHLAGKTLAQEVKAAAFEARKEWAASFPDSHEKGLPCAPATRLAKYLWMVGGMLFSAAAMALYRLFVG